MPVSGRIQFSRSLVSDSLWLQDCSTPGFPVHHQLSELAQTPTHHVSDAIQSSHPLSSTSLPTFNLSQHQGLFQWVSSSHQVAKGLEFQHQFFQWIFRVDFLLDWLVWSPCWPRNSQESSPTPQFESINSSALSLLYGPTLTSHTYMTTGKKAELQRNDAFELWCWRRLFRAPWTAKRSNQSILKEISTEYSLEGLMLNLKL